MPPRPGCRGVHQANSSPFLGVTELSVLRYRLRPDLLTLEDLCLPHCWGFNRSEQQPDSGRRAGGAGGDRLGGSVSERRLPMLSGMAGSSGSNALLSAVMIVRDEAPEMADCLASLRAVADEIVVYDTGSVDAPRRLSRAGGAVLVEGFWDDDFGRARTAAAEAATGTWLLIVDADERPIAEPAGLRALLAADRAVDGFSVRIDNAGEADGSGGYAHWGIRLVRRG